MSPFLNPTNFLFLTILIFLFIYLKSKNKIVLKGLILNISLIIIIAFVPLGSYGLKYLEKDYVINEKFENIKNILVLSGADKRIIASINLAYKHPNAKIFYVGGNAFLVKNKNNDDRAIARNFYDNLNFDM